MVIHSKFLQDEKKKEETNKTAKLFSSKDTLTKKQSII